jgi:hypothetical protein
MQNVARLFQMLIANTKNEIKAGKAVKMPESVQDVIWKISFTLGVDQPIKGGQFALSFKDFKVMSESDQAEFGSIIADINARRAAGQIQSQEAAEAEAEAAVVATATEAPATNAGPVSSEVAKQNAQIVI